MKTKKSVRPASPLRKTTTGSLNQERPPREEGSRAQGSEAGTGVTGDRTHNAHMSASSEMDRQAGAPGDPAGKV